VIDESLLDNVVGDYLAGGTPEAVTDSLRSSVGVGARTDPGVYSEAKQLAERTGVPVETALNQPDVLRQREKIENFDAGSFALENPYSAQLLSNPQMAKVAHDDVENMGAVEKAFKLLNNVSKAALSAVPAFNVGLYGAAETLSASGRKYLPFTSFLEPIGSFAHSQRVEAQRVMKGLTPSSQSDLEAGLYSGVQSTAMMIAPMVASILARSPTPALTTMATVSGGQAGAEALDKGLDPARATLYGVTQGSIEAATELVPVVKFLGDIEGGSTLLKTLWHQAIAEVPTENLATLLQGFNEWATLHPERPFRDYLDTLPSDLMQTTVAALTAVTLQGTVLHTADRFFRGTQRAQNAEQMAKAVDSVMGTASASELRTRDPAMFMQFLNRLSDTGAVKEVYINPDDLAKNGIDLYQMAEVSPSVAAQLDEATKLGTDIRIPISEFVHSFTDSPQRQQLLEHIKADPEAMSQAQAAEYYQTQNAMLKEEVGDLEARQQNDEIYRQSTDAVRMDIMRQLKEINRFTDDVNEPYATQMSGFYSAYAGRLGITPEEMYKRFPIKIAAEGLATDQDLGQPLNKDVDLNRRVNVVDIPALSKADLDSASLKEMLRGLVGQKIKTADMDRVLSVLPKNINHVVYSSIQQQGRGAQKSRRKAVAGIRDLINDAVLVESIPNKKKDAKPDVDSYHRFYVPVRVGGKVKTIRIVAEQTKQGLSFDPNNFDLYDVIPEQTPLPPSLTSQLASALHGSAARGNLTPSKTEEADAPDISIQQMLKGIKDSGGKDYFQTIQGDSTIEVDGVQRPTVNSEGRPIAATEEAVRNFWRWFGDSKVVDEQGRPLVVYSGHSNTELYGEAFNPSRGTAGAFYATEAPNIASNYSTGKFGVKESYEDGSQYRFKLKNGKWAKKIWQVELTPEQQDKARIFLQDEEKGMNHDIEQYWKDNRQHDRIAATALLKGGLRDLQSIYRTLDSMGYTISYPKDGNAPFFERQNKNLFENLLDELGIEWQSYDWQQPGVMPIYLSVKNPIDAEAAFPQDLLSSLEKKANRERRVGSMSDQWTKEMTLKDWVESIKSGDSYWSTQIPASGLPILMEYGYDGVKELGTKGATTRSERQVNWIAFSPEQIKSAVGNRGTFDANSPNILYQQNEAPIFYSQVQRAVEGLNLTKAPAEQWLKTLQNTPGVKQEELDWMGLPEWLAQQKGSITKDQLLEFVRANQIEVDEVVNSDEDAVEIRQSRGASPVWQIVEIGTGRVIGSGYDTEQEAIDASQDVMREAGTISPTKFHTYTLPGGKNYRELLMTLPDERAALSEEIAALNARMAEANSAERYAEYEALHKQREGLMDKFTSIEGYSSGHFDEKNILAHIRFNEREVVTYTPADIDRIGKKILEVVDAKDAKNLASGSTDLAVKKGAITKLEAAQFSHAKGFYNDLTGAVSRVLFIEEVQSDWHQAGRSKGYRGEKEKEFADLVAKMEAARNKRGDIVRAGEAQGMTYIEAVSQDAAIAADEEFIALQEQINKLGSGDVGVPDAPFKTTWPELAFKRALRWAVENNFDRVAWTTGEQQAERYDLSKHVEEIRSFPSVDGTYDIEIDIKSGGTETRRNMKQEDLADFVGKDLADKIATSGKKWLDADKKYREALKQIGTTDEFLDALRAERDAIQTDFSGLDLKVGGEGMKAFYDKILPNTVNKLVKKWGGKVGETVIGKPAGTVKDKEVADLARELGSDDKIKAFSAKVHSVEITPQMREAALSGLPLFQDKQGSFNTASSTISLLKAADLSTFIHESGHFFLETLTRLASDPTSPDFFRQDMGIFLKWANAGTLEEWNAKTLEQKRTAHERFARGFENYIFEGKAPSTEMRSLFQRFRAWMTNVYKSLTDFIKRHPEAQLNDEIRGVFDRMLATDKQIAEAQALRNMSPLFKSAQEAGMTEEEWGRYQAQNAEATIGAMEQLERRSLRDMRWAADARGRALRKLQRDVAAKRKAVYQEVRSEVMAEPVNRAHTFLSRGILNGEQVEGSHRFDTAALKEMYGDGEKALWRQLTRKYGAYGVIGNEGLHPDIIAEQFGFTSGDELIKKLIEAEDPQDKIEGLTEQRLLERYGDITSQNAMERAADEAVHNDARARFVATELKALQKMANLTNQLNKEAARQFAQDMVAGQRIRNLKPSRYAAAEARAAKAAEEATVKGNIADAALQKRNQLVNTYATDAAYKAISETAAAVKYLKKFNSEGTRKRLSNDYLDQIDKLLERYDLRPRSLKDIDKRASLLDWVESQRAIGIEPDIAPDLLAEARQQHYVDMTVEELRGLRDAVKQIEHLGRLKNKLLTAREQKDFDAVIEQLTSSILLHAPKTPVDNQTRATASYRAGQLFKGFVLSHRKTASLVKELDGFKDGGPVWGVFTRSMNDAGTKEATMRAAATERLMEIASPILKGERMGGKGVYFPTVKRSLNREERIAIALNMGNAGNVQRLLSGEGWSLDQIRPVLDSLTEPEWQFVQKVWDFFESYRPEIAAKERRVYGKEPAWVEPVPVATPYGMLRGGYYPIKYDPRRSAKAEQFADAEGAERMLRGAYTSATTRRSFAKPRADEVKGRPLLYTMDAIYAGTNEVIHDLAWHEWVIDANRILRNKTLDSTIRDRYGAEFMRQLKSAVSDIATGEMPAADALEKGLSHVRHGATVAGLGFNVVNAIQNFTGVPQAIVRGGAGNFMRGLARWANDPVGLIKEVFDKSSFMKLRSQTMQREINEVKSLVRDRSVARYYLDKYMFSLMYMSDMAVSLPMWNGVYEKALTDGAQEDKAIALADQAVLDALGGGQVKDLSAIQRGGPIRKLFTTYYGYFNATYNLAVERAKATDFKDPLDVLRLANDYALLMIVPSVISTLVKNALTGGDDDPEELGRKIANDQLSYIMGLMVGTRELTGMAQRIAGVEQFNTSYGGPAGLRFLNALDNLATQIDQGELDKAFIKSTVNVAGIAFHLPSAQINRAIDGFVALQEGDTENPLAPVFGVAAKR
jgi:hypothetical protein